MWPFGKDDVPSKLGDRVWMTKQKKYDSLVEDALKFLEEGKIVLISWYFTDTGTYINSCLKERHVDFTALDDVRPEIENKINIVQADSFRTHYFRDRLSLGTHEVVILFAEHYPLFKTENDLLQSLDSLGKHVSYFFYMSFDEPILTRFGAARVVELMKNLGVTEDEMISSTLITSAIVNVQKKVESKVKFEISGFSLEDWFDKNLRTTDLS
ncbi:MAG: hypothetical protein NTW10_04465 [Bacteroidetes bacterium]|nr:hypothetical protein [Bacteroidota bacterium]